MKLSGVGGNGDGYLVDVREEMVMYLMEVRGEWDGVREEWPESGSTGGKSPPETAKKTVSWYRSLVYRIKLSSGNVLMQLDYLDYHKTSQPLDQVP